MYMYKILVPVQRTLALGYTMCTYIYFCILHVFRLLERMSSVRIGDSLSAEMIGDLPSMGPVVSKGQYDKIWVSCQCYCLGVLFHLCSCLYA